MRCISSLRLTKQNVTTAIFILFLILLTFLPRLFSLSLHWATDEDLWMQRSRNFYFALKNGEFEDTHVAYHPGVTTCWLGSLAIWLTSQFGNFNSWFHSDQFMSPGMLARVRFPIVFLSGMLTLIAGILLYRLFDALYACIGTLFLAIEPFLISESRRAHTDVLTALFLFLALLLWLCYLEGETREPRRDLILSGICFGLACLTKSHAGAFIVFLPIMLIWYHHQCRIHWSKLVLSAMLWTASTLLTVGIIWPYLWTVKFGNLPLSPFLFVGSGVLLLWSWKKFSQETHVTFSKTVIVLMGCGVLILGILILFASNVVIGKMYKALTSTHPAPTPFLGVSRYNPGYLFYPVMWFVWTGVLTLPLIIFTMYRSWQIRQREEKIYRIVVVMLLFSIFYMIGLSFVAQKTSRYIVIFLPAISLLISIGAIQLARLTQKKWISYLVLVIIFSVQALPILRLYPYYRAYYNPLLSAKWVEEKTAPITGAGLDLAADYLNAKPDAERLRVRHTWFCKDFAHYFIGKTDYYKYDPATHNFDYDLEYLYDRQIIHTPMDISEDTTYRTKALKREQAVHRELEHIINLNGIDYVWIYRVIKPEPTGNTDVPAE